MNLVAALLTHLYTTLLRIYPETFQQEFAREMQVVFRDSVNEAVNGGILSLSLVCLRELAGLPVNILREFWFEMERRRAPMSVSEDLHPESTHTKRENLWGAWIGTLPFIVFGLVSILAKTELGFRIGNLYNSVYVIALLGLVIGGVRDFPRWSYSYLGWSLTYAWWWMGMPTVILGEIFASTTRNQLLGWWSWTPVLLAFGIILLWTRSLHPLRQLVHNIWQDWSLLSLAMYAFVGFVLLVYDENHHPYLFLFMTLSTIVVAAAAWFFLHNPNSGNRYVSIFTGFLLALIITWVCDATWDWNAYYHIPPSPPQPWYEKITGFITVSVLWSGIMFWPVLVGLARRAVNNRRTV